MSTVLKQLGCSIGMLLCITASAQVKTAPVVPKTEETKSDSNSNSATNSTSKKDTNTYTIINITGASTSKNKNTKLNTDTDQPNDVKTTVTKAKQTSKHWFDTFIVNIICVGVNTFVKNE